MRRVLDIYKEYNIPSNLERHMLSVAGVAFIICDNFLEPLPTKEILLACLFHDMGNIIKYDLNVFPQYLEPEGVRYWKKVQAEYIKKYGKEEHRANATIAEELRLSPRIVEMIRKIDFSLYCVNSTADDMGMKIVCYADGRVTPHGIMSYSDRMNEAKERYKNRGDLSIKKEDEWRKLFLCGQDIEKQIFARCKIKPEDISDDSIKTHIKKLKIFEI